MAASAATKKSFVPFMAEFLFRSLDIELLSKSLVENKEGITVFSSKIDKVKGLDRIRTLLDFRH